MSTSATPQGFASRHAPALQAVLVAALLGVGVLAVLLPANPAVHGLERDSGFYMYIGDHILQGKLPYRDAWESKPPAIFYLNAAALWLGRGSRWGVWLVELVFLAAAVALCFLFTARRWGTAPAVFTVLLVLVGFQQTFQGGNYTEEYPLPLHFAAVVLLPGLARNPRQKWGNAALGFLLGCVFLFRPNNIVVEAAIVLALAVLRLMEKDLRGLLLQWAWIGLGAAVPLIGTGVYFWSQGLLPDLLNASLLYNLAYSSTQIAGVSPLKVGLRAFGPVLLAIAAIGYVLAAVRLRSNDPQRPLYLFLLFGLPLAVLLSDPARRTYLHYYMNWVPFIGLLGGLALHAVLSRGWAVRLQAPRTSFAFLGAGLLAAVLFFGWGGAAQAAQTAFRMFATRGETGVELVPTVASYVAEHTGEKDTVLFWAVEPGYNFMSRREAPSGVLYYPLYVPSPISDALNERFLAELRQNRPALIVDMNDPRALSLDPAQREQQQAAGDGWSYLPANIGQVFDFVSSNYSYVAKVGGHAVYALKPGQ